MVVQALGKTTREMMTHYKEGDSFSDFVGPLGVPQHVEKVGHVVLVGGGLGVAPVYPQLRSFKNAGNRTTGIIGFRSQPLVFWEDRFGRYCDDLVVCTDDGSYGKPGFVTKALQELLEREKPDLVVAIGPLPMMNACVETTRPFGVKTMVSLNAIMVDGTGMCGSCRVTVDGKVKFACVEGPDFDGHQVDFKELMARQQRFKPQEATATEDYAHVCNLEQQLFQQQKRNYKKIKDLAPHATRMPERDALERSRNFKEVNLGYALQDALVEAERCIQCTKPTCIAGCPVAIDIPRFIRHLLVRDLDGALAAIHESNLFPSICGRVCPQESQCEAQCIIAKKVESVAIGRLERFVGDNATLPPAKPYRFAKKLGNVAIVGSGPAGLSCAADLVRFGADVTVYEALHVVGGVLRYGIPSFRLPREIIDREVQYLRDLGVKFETNKVIGKTFTVSQLLGEKGFDAVFLGVGAGAPTFLGIPGEFAGQVYSANEFLTRVNLMGGDKLPLPRHAGLDRQERGGDRGRQHRHGLPAGLEAPGRADRALRLPPHGGRGPGPHRGAAPRQGGGHRVLLPPRAGGDPRRRRRQRARHEGRGDGARRAGRQGAPQAGRHRPLQGPRVRHGHLRARHQGQPDRDEVDARPGPQQVGLHRRRRRDPGDQRARRLRGRRHRDRRSHRDPRHGRRAPRGQGDRHLPRTAKKRWPITREDVSAWKPIAPLDDSAPALPNVTMAAMAAMASVPGEGKTCAKCHEADRGRRRLRCLLRRRRGLLESVMIAAR